MPTSNHAKTALAKFKDDADLAAKIDSVEKEKHSWRSTLWLTYASLVIIKAPHYL